MSTSRFDPAERIVLNESDVWWDILPEALEKGRVEKRECQRARAEGAGLPDSIREQKRRRPKDRLRVKNPW